MLFAGMLLIVASVSVLAAFPTCYYSDQSTIAEGDIPCNTSAATSPCCLDIDFCLDNGLCLSYLNLIYESSCTDRQWGPGCQAFCSGTDGPNVLAICGPTWDAAAALLSCGWDSDCSDNFTVPYAKGIVLRADQAAAAGLSKPVVLYSDPSLDESNSTETSTADHITAHPTNAYGPLTTSNTSPSTSSREVKSFTAKDMAAVGAGVGVPLAIALVVAIALLFGEKKSKRYSMPPPSAPIIDPLPWQIHSPISHDDFGHSPKPREAQEAMSGVSERQELDGETVQKTADGPNFTIEA